MKKPSDFPEAEWLKYKYYTVEGEVTDHTLSLGLRIKAGNNAWWSAITDVSLTYLDGQRGILRDTYNEAQTIYKEYDAPVSLMVASSMTAQRRRSNTRRPSRASSARRSSLMAWRTSPPG